METFAPELLFVESGGDNLAAQFSRELADYTIYVIDVSGGDKIPRKGGPGITQSDLLVINKTDLAPLVGADLGVMERDARQDARRRPVRLRAGDARRRRRRDRRTPAAQLAPRDQPARRAAHLSGDSVSDVNARGFRVLGGLGPARFQRLGVEVRDSRGSVQTPRGPEHLSR